MAGDASVKRFALIGAAGYIAPKHLKAIRETGNELVAAVDPHDSVGVLDSYFPHTRFFTEIERFDRHLEKLRRQQGEERVDYISVCTPNYLHDAHVRLALRVRAHAICEKPLVINPWNLDALADLEDEFQTRIYTVLQLRLADAVRQLKADLDANPPTKKADVVLTYITRRGPWYNTSWKGSSEKSGGVAMNIGIHFFDLLLWLFGNVERNDIHLRSDNRNAGVLELDRARVRWFLSTDADDLPAGHLEQGKFAERSLTLDGREIDFSAGFTDLHTRVYQDILAGGGYGVTDARPSIELVHRVRSEDVASLGDVRHPKLM